MRAVRAVKPATAAGVASSETAADCASVATSALKAGAVVSAAAGFSDAAAAAVIDRSAPINADRPSGAPAWPTAAAAAAAEKPAAAAAAVSLEAKAPEVAKASRVYDDEYTMAMAEQNER